MVFYHGHVVYLGPLPSPCLYFSGPPPGRLRRLRVDCGQTEIDRIGNKNGEENEGRRKQSYENPRPTDIGTVFLLRSGNVGNAHAYGGGGGNGRNRNVGIGREGGRARARAAYS